MFQKMQPSWLVGCFLLGVGVEQFLGIAQTYLEIEFGFAFFLYFTRKLFFLQWEIDMGAGFEVGKFTKEIYLIICFTA